MTKQLTRNEAIKKYLFYFPMDVGVASRHVDFLIALGVFTPAEPKTVDSEVQAILMKYGCSWGQNIAITCALEQAGFKIVKA